MEQRTPKYISRARRAQKLVKKADQIAAKDPKRAAKYRETAQLIRDELYQHKRCMRCGRPLKNEDSQKRGYGTECADFDLE